MIDSQQNRFGDLIVLTIVRALNIGFRTVRKYRDSRLRDAFRP